VEGERRVAVIPDGWYQGRVRRIAWSSPAGTSGAPTNKTFYGIVTRVRTLHTPKIRRPSVHREILFLSKHPKPQPTPHTLTSGLFFPSSTQILRALDDFTVYPPRGSRLGYRCAPQVGVSATLAHRSCHRWDPGLFLAMRCFASFLALQTHAWPRPPLPLFLGLSGP
jgi:hypothetical protein